jgi:hypothetical protein
VKSPSSRRPVDEVLPAKELATFGLQHALGMYAGAVAVPLIVGAAFKVSPRSRAGQRRPRRDGVRMTALPLRCDRAWATLSREVVAPVR